MLSIKKCHNPCVYAGKRHFFFLVLPESLKMAKGLNEKDIACLMLLCYHMGRNNRVTGWLSSILHRMGVVLMDKKPFDFKDLMAFGMFILALLTFVFMFVR